MSEHCPRGHVIAGYGDVDTYCNRCMDDLCALESEIDALRDLILSLPMSTEEYAAFRAIAHWRIPAATQHETTHEEPPAHA